MTDRPTATLSDIQTIQIATLKESYGSWDRYQEAFWELPERVVDGLLGIGGDTFSLDVEVLKVFCSDDKKWSAYLSKVQERILPAQASTIPATEPAMSPQKQLSAIGSDSCIISNLLTEDYEASERTAVYIGRAMPSYGYASSSPLCNKTPVSGQSQAARDKACSANAEDLIRVLKAQKGPEWDEIKRLALMLRDGKKLRLLCYCAPRRCHGSEVSIVITGLANRRPVPEIIKELQSRVQSVQATLGI